MVKKAALVLVALFTLLGLVSSSALAQTYSFRVPEETVHAYFNSDGTLSLDYYFTFANDPSASPIDFVDIGLPNGDYDLNSVSADVDGRPITDISKADPANLEGGQYGITLALGGDAIQPGATGTVHAYIGTIRRMLYPYNFGDVKDYVSVNFSPTWFGSAFAHGNTNFAVVFHLPPGVKPEEPIYYQPSDTWPGPDQPETALDDENRVMYTWTSPQANAYTKYTFGAGFPAKYIPAAAIVRAPAFRIAPESLCCLGFGLFFVAIFGFSIYSATVGARKRKLAYLPPKISIEGHGIKRGLTSVEAAILMEQPIDKVMTMILFGLLKKGAATVTTREPLEVQAADPLPEGLNPYETQFLAAFRQKGPARRTALQEMTVDLVKSISEKVKGFSRKETVAYYEDITKRAWEQVEAAGTPEVKSQKYEEVMDWTMLDRRYGDRTRDVFGPGPVFVPTWWGRYDPVFRGGPISSTPTQPVSGTGGRSISMPSLPGSDFAASVVNGVQNFSAGVLGNLTSFTSAVTNQTNPPPPPSTSSSRGGRGGGTGGGHCVCACACACAGCACACAGGGR